MVAAAAGVVVVLVGELEMFRALARKEIVKRLCRFVWRVKEMVIPEWLHIVSECTRRERVRTHSWFVLLLFANLKWTTACSYMFMPRPRSKPSIVYVIRGRHQPTRVINYIGLISIWQIIQILAKDFVVAPSFSKFLFE